ncbi:hypothetical protein CRV24_008695 [Beauveria bassiana]|nr:hypothetical protein CRV24_008695 [Beauveria bassiana]KAH8715351.1 hypothetical protein HC256_004180 [Beauveria bassiana]
MQLPLIILDQPAKPVRRNNAKRQASSVLDEYLYGGRRPVAALGVPIQIGTPPQTVILEPDTASASLWIAGLRNGQARDEPQSVYFDAKSSSSFQNFTKVAVERYGRLSNDYYVLTSIADDVSFAGKKLGQLKFGFADLNIQNPGREVGILPLGMRQNRNSTVEKQRWVDRFKKNPAQMQDAWAKMQTYYDSLGAHFDTIDDLLGMFDNYDDFWTSVLDKQVISERIFGMAVRENGRGGLTLGGLDTGKFSGSLHKLPITDLKAKQ